MIVFLLCTAKCIKLIKSPPLVHNYKCFRCHIRNIKRSHSALLPNSITKHLDGFVRRKILPIVQYPSPVRILLLASLLVTLCVFSTFTISFGILIGPKVLFSTLLIKDAHRGINKARDVLPSPLASVYMTEHDIRIDLK